MSDIRPLTLSDLPLTNNIRLNAFATTSDFSLEGQQAGLDRLMKQIKDGVPALYGVFRDDNQVGVFKCYDFMMNFMGQFVPLGGLGGVAVDLLHKKQGVARELVEYVQRHYEERGYPFTALYPFRPDFYRRMGYCFGSPRYEYRVAPDGIIAEKHDQKHLIHYPLGQIDELQACYQRMYLRTHGFMAHDQRVFRIYHYNVKNRFLVYKPADKVEGYLIYRFKQLTDENVLRQRLHVAEMVYEHPEALNAMLAFLQAQADQVEEIYFVTNDPALHYRFLDPRDSVHRLFPPVVHQIGVKGLGIMYKITSMQNVFHALRNHNFANMTLDLTLYLEDTLQPEYAGKFTTRFKDGQASLVPSHRDDVSLRLTTADFTAVLLGCVSLKDLARLGMAAVSDPERLEQLNTLFKLPQRPFCLTEF